jgi:NAD(P)-dependent dehydrogenase (short-subunit alcohol dehydrogenase family)
MAATRAADNIAELAQSSASLTFGKREAATIARRFRIPHSAFRTSPMSNIVLTGAGRGLGRAMVERFVADGHVVYACSQSKERVAELRAKFKGPHRFAAVNVTNDDQVAAWAKDILDEAGPPDLLLNNAAVCNKNANLWEVPADEFEWVIDVNIKGIFYVLRHFLPAMVQRGQGVIVNFSSGWGRSTSAEVAPYCATKYAVEGLTQALAQELPLGMCAVPLNPGIINTDMLQSAFGENANSYVSPDEWAQKAVPFLLGLGPKDNGKSLTAPQ